MRAPVASIGPKPSTPSKIDAVPVGPEHEACTRAVSALTSQLAAVKLAAERARLQVSLDFVSLDSLLQLEVNPLWIVALLPLHSFDHRQRKLLEGPFAAPLSHILHS